MMGVDDDGNGKVDDVYGYDFANNDADPMDDESHGTHVAGIIAAQGDNSEGVAGVSWSAKLMALKYLDDDGTGFVEDAVSAINYVTMMRGHFGVNVRVINASFGGSTYNQTQRDAIEAAGEIGILFVCSAGNDGQDNDVTDHYPSNYTLDNIIAVAATDDSDELRTNSNYGETSVDLAAPGGSICSTMPGGDYGYKSGTSMAAPHVAGVAALAWSMAPAATYQEIRAAIFEGVDELDCLSGKTVTGGRLNALGTINALGARIQGTIWNDLDGDGSRDPGEAVLRGRTVYLDLDDDGAPSFGPDTVSSTDVPHSISDYATITSQLLVNGVSGMLTDVDVTLDISHAWDADLDVYLISPGGTKVELFTDVGSGGDNFSALSKKQVNFLSRISKLILQ